MVSNLLAWTASTSLSRSLLTEQTVLLPLDEKQVIEAYLTDIRTLFKACSATIEQFFSTP